MKTIIAIIVIILIAAGIYRIDKTPSKNDMASSTVATTTEGAAGGKIRGIDDVASVKASDIVWKFEDMGEDASGIPSTKVSVMIQQNTYPVGTYQGSCFLRETKDLNKNELSGALCWAAGGGDELGVYKEDGRLYIRHRLVEEGTAEEAGVPGEFHTILML